MWVMKCYQCISNSEDSEITGTKLLDFFSPRPAEFVGFSQYIGVASRQIAGWTWMDMGRISSRQL